MTCPECGGACEREMVDVGAGDAKMAGLMAGPWGCPVCRWVHVPEWGTWARTEPCTPACYAQPDCTTCGKRKAPRGRDVPMAAALDYCHPADCAGYYQAPLAGHLWPGEEPES